MERGHGFDLFRFFKQEWLNDAVGMAFTFNKLAIEFLSYRDFQQK